MSRVKTSPLAIAALVLAIVFPPLGFVLGIIAYTKIKGSPTPVGGKNLAIAAMCLPAACVPVAGILAAIAIPNYMRFALRSKAAEARVTLMQLATAERMSLAEEGYLVSFASNPGAAPTMNKVAWEERPCPEACSKDAPEACSEAACMGFAAEGPVYYRYSCVTEGGGFVCVAVGDLDGDGELAIWAVGSEEPQPSLPAIAHGKCPTPVPARPVDCRPNVF